MREGGDRSDAFETERPGFACMLGGEDGRALFICEADWLGREAATRAGKVLMARAARRQPVAGQNVRDSSFVADQLVGLLTPCLPW